MIIEDSGGDVGGLVALEIGRKDDVEEAQLVVVVILGHADGWPENVAVPAHSLLSQLASWRLS